MFNKLFDSIRSSTTKPPVVLPKVEESHPTELGSGGVLRQTPRQLFDSLRLIRMNEEDDVFASPSNKEVEQRKIDRALAIKKQEAEIRRKAIQEVIDNILKMSVKNSDGSLTVNGDINLGWGIKVNSFADLKLNISRVNGSLNLGGKIHNLVGLPKIVAGMLDISSCSLSSIAGIPQILPRVDGDSYKKAGLDCGDNNLKTLEGLPQTFPGDLLLGSCGIKNLVGLPITIKGKLDLRGLQLASLQGLPRQVAGDLHVSIKHLVNTPNKLEPLFNCNVGGLLMLDVPEDFNLKDIDWRRLRAKKGIRIVENKNANESLKSDVLRFLRPLFAVNQPSTYNSRGRVTSQGKPLVTGIQWDKISDTDIQVENQPVLLVKDILAGKYDNKSIFWILTRVKGRAGAGGAMYAKTDTRELNLPFLMTITKGKTVSYKNPLIKPTENLNQMAKYADIAIVIDTEPFDNTNLKNQRSAAKKDAVSFYSNEEILAKNRSRYQQLLRNKRADVDIKSVVKNYLTELTALAYEVKLNNNTMDDFIQFEVGKTGEISDFKIRDPKRIVDGLLGDLWRQIDDFNSYSMDMERDKTYYATHPEDKQPEGYEPYALEKIRNIRSRIISAYNAFKAKRIQN